MTIAAILSGKGGDVVTATTGQTVAETVALLAERRIGAVPVLDEDGAVAGVFSERDVVRALAIDGAAALARPVADYMTAKVIFAEPREEMSALMARMTDRRIRHLPVLEGQRLIGVVSIGDVVKCQIAEHAQEADSLRSYIAG